MFVFLGLWVAVSIAGGAKALSAILVTFSMAALVVLSGALVGSGKLLKRQLRDEAVAELGL